MKNQMFFVLTLVLLSGMTYSQVAINTAGTPAHASAMLDVQSASRGLLVPRVALTASNLIAPISSSPATGLLVYNTATAGAGSTAVFPGYYHWNGSSWNRALTNTGSFFTSYTIPYWNPGGDLSSCSSFYWDNANSRLGIGTASPGQQLEITQSLKLSVTTDATTGVIYKGGDWFIHNYEDAGTDGYNTFVGEDCGNFTLSGYFPYEASDNTAIGSLSLYVLSDGYKNTAVGSRALRWNDEGYLNTSVGAFSMEENNSGDKNVVVGAYAGTGTIFNSYSNNSFFGYSAGNDVTTGSNNILIGFQAGDNLTSGSNNIVIGYDINVPSATSSNQLVLGNSELLYGDLTNNRIGIGTTVPSGQVHVESNTDVLLILDADANDSGEDDNPRLEMRQDAEQVIGALGYIGYNGSIYTGSLFNALYLMNEYNSAMHFGTDGGIVMTVTDDSLVGILTTSPSVALDVNGNGRFRAVGSTGYTYALNLTSNGTLTTNSSDIRLKTNIESIDDGLKRVLNLRGVRFNWKENPEDKKMIGFIAQEVERVVPELVFTNPTDGFKGVNYAEMTAILVEAVKEQQKEIEIIKSEYEKLLADHEVLMKKIKSLEETQRSFVLK